MGIPEKIKQIEDEIHRTQINKKTEHHIGILKAKLAKLRHEQEEISHLGKKESNGFSIRKSGHSTVVLIGLPNVGKSTLVNRLTNSKSKIGEYQFTTLKIIPGIMNYKGARIQILDLPGIIEGASTGKGLGKRILGISRSADLILFVLDIFQPNVYNILKTELLEMGIRPDEKPPQILIEKVGSGGIHVSTQVQLTKISTKLIKDVLRIYDFNNAKIIIKENISYVQLIDAILGNRIYIPSLIIMNKIDLVNINFLNELKKRTENEFFPISADKNINIKELKEHIFQRLNLIRIFISPRKGGIDFKDDLFLKNGSTILVVCNKIHRKMKNDFRYALIWGKSAKFEGQKVGLKHKIIDKDVITLVTK
jgi:ribosome-interacting GTPase 1